MQPVAQQAVAALDDPALYFNRELSWLEFNSRVLDEARDPDVPLLERLKFLAIFSSNLDEFFMVRVGGVQQKVQAGLVQGSGADRMPPQELLDRIGQVVRQLVADQYRCLNEDVLPALEREGIALYINARTDVYLKQLVPAERAVAETRARGARYLDAGASGVFVPLLTAPDAIRELVAAFDAPLNLLIVPGLAPIAELAALGVRRVSAGGGLSRAAYVAARECAEQLLTTGRYERMLGGPALDMNKLLAER